MLSRSILSRLGVWWRAYAVLASIALAAAAHGAADSESPKPGAASAYPEFLALFSEWQHLEHPPRRDGAADYSTATLAAQQVRLHTLQRRLDSFQPGAWTVSQQVDYQLVRAEMNGLDFNLRVLQPWARDPAFYATLETEQSDTPAHEGPKADQLIELWAYRLPLTREAQRKLAAELRSVPPFLAAARVNLTGNARDLWLAGTNSLRAQEAALEELGRRIAPDRPEPELVRSLDAAERATAELVRWLDGEASAKIGPSGVGKDNYTWNLRHVHLVPLSWDQEVAILRHELARAHASLRFEEQRNRALPPLAPIATPEEYQQRANAAVSRYISFLRDRDILEVRDFHDPAMRAHIGSFTPAERRNFFVIVSHHEPLALFTHFYHWFDHAYMDREPNPSPVRNEPLPYNIWDNRAEGMATTVEELMMQAGLYDDTPRVRELVWIMLAQRCARGLASLYAQANIFDLAQAKAFQVRWTPRGWMRPDLDLLNFEQQLYLRQPGYGSSYVTGKYLIEELIKDRSAQLGAEFSLKRFFAEYNAAGVIPVSLIRWELTGADDALREINSAP
jgi:hypothetical protein